METKAAQQTRTTRAHTIRSPGHCAVFYPRSVVVRSCSSGCGISTIGSHRCGLGPTICAGLFSADSRSTRRVVEDLREHQSVGRRVYTAQGVPGEASNIDGRAADALDAGREARLGIEGCRNRPLNSARTASAAGG